MLSEHARHAVNRIFTNAAQANLAVTPGDRVDVRLLDAHAAATPPEKSIVVLTIASYVFRLLTIFHVDHEGETAEYFTQAGAAGTFRDCFGEIGNRCCGAMNRELGHYFQHLGMSTPAMLEAKCLPFLTELKPTYLARHRIEINHTLRVHATLCFCAYAPVDFRLDPSLAAEATGELELF